MARNCPVSWKLRTEIEEGVIVSEVIVSAGGVVVLGLVTVMVAEVVATEPSLGLVYSAKMVATPAPTPVTSPCFTVATAVLFDVHVMCGEFVRSS